MTETRFDHSVYLYEPGDFPLEPLADFLARPLAADQPCLAIATRSHLDQLGRHLDARGLGWTRAVERGRCVVLDAGETLERIRARGEVDPGRFRQVLGRAVDRAADPQRGEPVTVFGEMIDLLWIEGDGRGAVELERLWNDLLRERDAALVCGLSLSTSRAVRAAPLVRICGQHSQTLPKLSTAHSDPESHHLRREIRELTRSNRSKEDFLAVVAHELRNPLAPVQTAASLARLRLARGAGVDHELELIERQAESMARLVEDLLDLSRLARGAIELRREPVELGALLAGALEATRHWMEQRRHALRLSPGESPIHVFGDPVRLEQILVNLLVNAAKYTPAGGCIRVRTGRAGDRAELAVRDNGIGIAPEMLDRVFDLFERANRSRESAAGGLGIGLAISRRLAELHGGTIESWSEGLGRGSEFTLRLPLLRQDQGVRAPPPAEPGRQRALCVLVVDDHVDAGEALGELLREGLGHQARVARDGPSALQLARELRPDVVLLDLGLPGMDGYEVALQLHAAGSAARLIAVTGYGEPRDRAHTKSAGFADHLVKPVRLDALRRALDAG